MDSAGRSYEEMRDDEEVARDPVLGSVPPPIGTGPRHLSWPATPLMAAWSWFAIGAAGVVLTVAWRVVRYLELYSYAQDAFITMM
eukprot:13068970-Heterocapsa_arctica.AAC.1